MTLHFEDKNSKAKKIFEANENLSNEDQSKECYRMKHEVPHWNSDTKWPQSALDILNAKEVSHEYDAG